MVDKFQKKPLIIIEASIEDVIGDNLPKEQIEEEQSIPWSITKDQEAIIEQNGKEIKQQFVDNVPPTWMPSVNKVKVIGESYFVSLPYNEWTFADAGSFKVFAAASTMFGTCADMFRNRCGYAWTHFQDANKDELLVHPQVNGQTSKKIFPIYIKGRIPEGVSEAVDGWMDTLQNGLAYYVVPDGEQFIGTEKDKLVSLEYFVDYLKGGYGLPSEITGEFTNAPTFNMNEPYDDFTFSYARPTVKYNYAFPKEEIDNSLVELCASVSYKYGFQIPKYEKLVSQDGVSEAWLPNLYLTLLDKKFDGHKEKYRNFITLGSLNKNTKEKNIWINNSEYFEQWSEKLQKITEKDSSITTMEAELKPYRNIIFSSLDMSLLKEALPDKHLYPMAIEIEFENDSVPIYGSFLRQTGLLDHFMASAVENMIDGPPAEEGIFIPTYKVKEIYQESTKNTKENKWDVKTVIQDAIYTSYTNNQLQGDPYINEWEEGNKGRYITIGQNFDGNVEYLSKEQYDIYRALMNLLKSAKHAQFTEQCHRPFETVMDGEEAYSETLFYRIAKCDSDNLQKPLQNFYVACKSEDDNIIRYIDTQVKYNKSYTYVVTAFKLVIGNEYMYKSAITQKDSLNPAVALILTDRAVAKFMEVPYCIFKDIKVIDNPPLPPMVDIIPMKGVDDQVKVFLQAASGDEKLYPVPLTSKDTKMIEYYQKFNQEIYPAIVYSGDDQISRFEMWESKEHPKGWGDFKRVDKMYEKLLVQGTMSLGVTLSIEPNKDYYYMFRVIDNHGHTSNPSVIYHVKMINDNGLIYPIINVVDFLKEDKKTISKTVRRFIRIRPAVQHTFLNEEKINIGEVKLGYVSDSTWDKTFIMTIRSRYTGKKAEIRFKFATDPNIQKVEKMDDNL